MQHTRKNVKSLGGCFRMLRNHLCYDKQSASLVRLSCSLLLVEHRGLRQGLHATCGRDIYSRRMKQICFSSAPGL
ncbi:tripartite motif-containing protein 40-like [Iris pallida]|uniref:Tripartite motif-containing protein 40-like n=1 Tax=Iris pallida TaxID=29817 RepID=A0AAX6GTJ7_IRIPA|nr:tripartite motif-containing protein 40-like [Iris pallida]